MRRLLLTLVPALLLAAPVLGAQVVPAQPGLPGTAQIEAFTLQPGDALRVTIWREQDLSGEFPVDEQGRITLPLLGEKRVLGIPVARLRDTLISEYRQHLRNPSIEIIPLRRVYILGEVNKPGLYAVDPTVSLAGAIAIAGGPTAIGDVQRIRIVRGGAVLMERTEPGTALTTGGIRSGDQVFIERRGWFERNTPFVISTLLSLTSIITTIVISR